MKRLKTQLSFIQTPGHSLSHREIVGRYDVPGECAVRIADWPYECDAKKAHPERVVYICDTHRVWWHEPDWQPADVPDAS